MLNLQADDIGVHKRFYDIDGSDDDVAKILRLPTKFAFKDGEYVNAPQFDRATSTAQGLKFLECVRRKQDPSLDAHKHQVGGAASGALRDIQRMQLNPDLRINHGDWAVIRNEPVEGEAEFHPFQVVKIIEVIVDAKEYITKLWVHECGGYKPAAATGTCDESQTYKPRYKGIDPVDRLEKDLFYERVPITKWHKPVLLYIDPLTVVEWGKTEMMLTTTRRLKMKVLEVISNQPRVQWKLPEKDQKVIESKADNRIRRATLAQKKTIPDKRRGAKNGNKEPAKKRRNR
jgi:hypothetical protein